MTRQRITEGYVVHLADTLTPREQAIVATLDRLRVANGTQLERLHFAGLGSQRTIARRARRTLGRLVTLHVLARLERRIGGAASGSSGSVYALDVAGQRLASACGPAGGRRLRRPWTPGAAFVDHQLAVTELYVRLAEAERASSLELLAFDAEPLCWRSFSGIGGARAALKPDAFTRLGVGANEAFYFIEVDRATQSLPAIARKLAVYRRYYQTGREQERFGVFPQVRFVVPGERRRMALAELARAHPSARLFEVTRFDDTVALLTGREGP